MDALGRDIKSQVFTKHALNQTDITAGGAGDNTLITGTGLNLANYDKRPRSVSFEVPCEATLGDGETLIVTGSVETYDGSAWSVAVASATLLTLTGGAGGSTEKDVARVGANLAKQDVQQVRVKITPDLSRANTDTAKIGAGVALFGGLNEYPG